LAESFPTPNAGAPAPFRLQPDAAEHLLLHAWPENLRGVDRFVHRVMTSGEKLVGRRLLAALMPEIINESSSSDPPQPSAEPPLDVGPAAAQNAERQVPDRPTREQFLEVYESTGRNVRATSKHFGRDRRQIYRWLEFFGIER
jgi:transcriptional regulator of acetoin/glycerol metabolism